MLLCVNEYRDVAMAIVKSNQMESALRNTSKQGEKVVTPMRRIIKKMPGTNTFNTALYLNIQVIILPQRLPRSCLIVVP